MCYKIKIETERYNKVFNLIQKYDSDTVNITESNSNINFLDKNIYIYLNYLMFI